MTEPTVIERMARAIMKAGGCGLTIEGEHVFCDDERALPGVRTTCDCRAQAKAALGALRYNPPDQRWDDIIWAACGDTDPAVATALVESVLDQIEDEEK